MNARPTLHGVDFSSAPTRRKPIVVASGDIDPVAPTLLHLNGFDRLPTLDDFACWLTRPGPWVAALDLPFGLPRELVDTLRWPGHAGDTAVEAWQRLIAFVGRQSRQDLRTVFRGWCDARPTGGKFAHRACDRLAGSSPSMKWVNPPVAWMLHAGAPRLLEAGVQVPGLQAGDPDRVALEAYPGHLARAVLGRRSYKNDSPAKQTAERREARVDLVKTLAEGTHPLGFRLRASPTLVDSMVNDGTADQLDAAICLLQAAWAWERRDANWGLPAAIDPVEGWIAGLPLA